MAISAERKEHPISLRIPETDIALIDRAATCAAGRAALLNRSPR